MIADGAPYDRPVFLLYMGAVILLTSPTTREGDLFLFAVAIQVVIDKLGAVIRIDIVLNYVLDRQATSGGWWKVPSWYDWNVSHPIDLKESTNGKYN
jgi:hypothetical protein